MIVTERVAAAPMRYTASTLPTRSTTAMVALTPRACASATACAMTCWTSATVRLVVEPPQLPLQPPVVSVPVVVATGSPPEHAATSASCRASMHMIRDATGRRLRSS